VLMSNMFMLTENGYLKIMTTFKVQYEDFFWKSGLLKGN
jgi:hypothetical protein